MGRPRRFLIVDNNSAARFLVSKTLLRHYPQAVVQECEDLNTATEFLGALPAIEHATVVIARRTDQIDGRELILALRAAHPTVPIVWTADRSQAKWAQSVGATRFLESAAWLLIGVSVEDLN